SAQGQVADRDQTHYHASDHEEQDQASHAPHLFEGSEQSERRGTLRFLKTLPHYNAPAWRRKRESNCRSTHVFWVCRVKLTISVRAALVVNSIRSTLRDPRIGAGAAVDHLGVFITDGAAHFHVRWLRACVVECDN